MNDEANASKRTSDRLDAVFVQSRRELGGILLIWMFFALWVVGTSWFLAYPSPDEEIGLILGMPSWAFWSIGVPWMGANVAIFWFCLVVMKDQSLEPEESDIEAGSQS